jgi:hypothetical protein
MQLKAVVSLPILSLCLCVAGACSSGATDTGVNAAIIRGTVVSQSGLTGPVAIRAEARSNSCTDPTVVGSGVTTATIGQPYAVNVVSGSAAASNVCIIVSAVRKTGTQTDSVAVGNIFVDLRPAINGGVIDTATADIAFP